MAKTGITGIDTGVVAPSSGAADAGVAFTAVPALQAGWVAVAGFQAPQYGRTSDGEVRLRGQIDTGTKTAGTLLFTLPVGFRPVAKETFPVFSDVAAGAVSALVVDTDGTVKIGTVTLTAASSISLASVRFYAA